MTHSYYRARYYEPQTGRFVSETPIGLDGWSNFDDPDLGLRAQLTAHKAVFPPIRKHRGPGTVVYLEIIIYYSEGESPRGLFMSRETISLLSELGGALDNDVVEEVTGGVS